MSSGRRKQRGGRQSLRSKRRGWQARLSVAGKEPPWIPVPRCWLTRSNAAKEGDQPRLSRYFSPLPLHVPHDPAVTGEAEGR